MQFHFTLPFPFILRMDVSFTVDYEPDCPPYMTDTFRGVEEATGPLLEMLRDEEVPSTFFSTGVVAERYPEAMRAIVAGGHELGCHGHTHRKFPDLAPDEAREEIETSTAILRQHGPVTSFRAPNLVFPAPYLDYLADAGFALDSSEARYKLAYWSSRAFARDVISTVPGLHRIPASVTSSVLRLPRPIREAYLSRLDGPVVLFVHPWEFVDLRHTDLRLDCRFATGATAMRRVRAVLQFFRRRGARFVRMRDLPTAQGT